MWCKMTCRSRSLKSFKCMCLIDSRVDPSPRDGCLAIISDAHGAAMSPTREDFRGNIVPHGRDRGEERVYKVERGNAFALLPQYSNQGATWAPHGLTRLCHVALRAASHPCGFYVLCQRPCHVSSAVLW